MGITFYALLLLEIVQSFSFLLLTPLVKFWYFFVLDQKQKSAFLITIIGVKRFSLCCIKWLVGFYSFEVLIVIRLLRLYCQYVSIDIYILFFFNARTTAEAKVTSLKKIVNKMNVVIKLCNILSNLIFVQSKSLLFQ